MNTSHSYKPIATLAKSIASTIDKLDQGALSINEVQGLLEEARELHERIAILQYALNTKAPVTPPQAETASSTIAPAEVVENATETPEKKQESTPLKDKKSFKLNFNLFTPEPEPTNQINLLDVIEEEVPAEAIAATPVHVQVVTETPVVATVIEEKIVVNEVVQHTQSSTTTALKYTEKTVKSLNDKLAETNVSPTTLATKLSRKPVKDLTEEIGLNQKFLFMNDLFGGENTLYKEAIVSLNGFSTFDEAKQMITVLASRHNWDLENTSVLKFIDLVERRYIS